jgi:hypothetical protein
MPDLIVPIPTWKAGDPPSPLASLEKPVEVLGGPVTFANGQAFTAENLGKAGYFVFRQVLAGAVEEIWNESGKRWQAFIPGDLASLEPAAFAPQPGAPLTWKATLVAAGQQDAQKHAKFAKAAPAFPRYTLRAYFASMVGPAAAAPLGAEAAVVSGLSAPSLPLRFTSIQDAAQAGLRMPEGQTPETAEEVRYFLRVNGMDAGWVLLQHSGAGALVEVGNSAGARVRLLPTGDIVLQPAAGRRLFVEGALETDQVFYQPSNPAGNPVGPKRWLP